MDSLVGYIPQHRRHAKTPFVAWGWFLKTTELDSLIARLERHKQTFHMALSAYVLYPLAGIVLINRTRTVNDTQTLKTERTEAR
jgi:hypothetical protein